MDYCRLRCRNAPAKEALLNEITSAETAQAAEQKYDSYTDIYGEDDSAALCLAKYYIKASEADKSDALLVKLQNQKARSII